MARTISRLNVVLGATVNPFVQAFRGPATGAIKGLSGNILGLGSGLLRLTGLAAGLGLAWGAVKAAAGGLELASDIEQTTVALETMLRSVDQARVLLADLKDFAAKTPFTFPETAKAAKQLIAYGFSAGNVTRELTMLGDIASGVGANLGDLTYIFGTLRKQSHAYAIDIRQFAEKGIPIYEALAKTLKVSTGDINDMVKAGKIGFNEVRAALESLTAKGGQFAGMMKKQSQTMKGLWSTLADNIGFAFSSVLLKLVEVFHLRDAMRALIDATGQIGKALELGLTRYSGLVVQFATMVWRGITGAFARIKAFVGPIAVSMVTFVAENWKQLYATTAEVFLAMYSYVSAILTTMWGLVTTVAGGLVTAWGLAMNWLGLSTLDLRDKSTNTSEKIVATFTWLGQSIANILTTAAYNIKNWRLIFDIAAAQVALSVIGLGETLKYFFTSTIPTYLLWFAGNWKQIWATIANFTATVFSNMAENIGNFFDSVLAMAFGMKGQAFTWKPLTDGFKSAMTELPKIAARGMTPLEGAMSASLTGMINEYKAGLAAALSDNGTAGKAAATSLGAMLDNIQQKFQEAGKIEPPKLPDVKLITKPEVADVASAGGKAKHAHQQDNELVRAGSAKSESLRQGDISRNRLVDWAKLQANLQEQANIKLDAIKANTAAADDVEEGDL